MPLHPRYKRGRGELALIQYTMLKLFSRKKDDTQQKENIQKSKSKSLVYFDYNEDYVDVIFNERYANKTNGEYIYNSVGAFEKIGKPNDTNAEFIKYSVFEFALDSLDYISKGDTIFVIRRNENDYVKEISNEVLILPQVVCPQDGVLEVFTKEKQPIKDNDLICRIHLNFEFDNANSPKNGIYQGKYDKYEIPKLIRDSNPVIGKFVFLTKWLVNNGDTVVSGEKIMEVKGGNSDSLYFTYELRSKASGIIDFIKSPTQHFIDELNQKEILYLIYKDENIRFKNLYSNEIDIQTDNFTNTKTIKWSIVGGLKYPFNSDTPNPIGGVISDSSNGQSLIFSFQNHSAKDYIAFKFFAKEYKLKINDQVDFLFDDNELVSFKISEKSYKVVSNWKQLFETKVAITQEELNSFKAKKLLKWRIKQDNSNQVIDGLANNDWYENDNFHRVVQNLVFEYIEAVNLHVENHSPLLNKLETETESLQKKEECYVYLMIDTTNNFHKIGISNSPEYREKTLQSDKPTIELICAKKFPSRKIAESIEKALHTTFADKRLRGEWFELNNTEIEDIKETFK